MTSLKIKSNSSPRTTRPYKVWLLPSSEPQSPSLYAFVHYSPATMISGLCLGHHYLLPAQELALAIPSALHSCFQLFTWLNSVGP